MKCEYNDNRGKKNTRTQTLRWVVALDKCNRERVERESRERAFSSSLLSILICREKGRELLLLFFFRLICRKSGKGKWGERGERKRQNLDGKMVILLVYMTWLPCVWLVGHVGCDVSYVTCSMEKFMSAFSVHCINGVSPKDEIETRVKC